MTDRAHPNTPIDPEQIAALIDGKLPAETREQLLRSLDSNPELLGLVAEAASVAEVTQSREDVIHSAGPRRLRPRQSRVSRLSRQRLIYMTAIAATVIALVWLPLARRGFGTPDLSAIIDEAGRGSAVEVPDYSAGANRGLAEAAATESEAVRIGAALGALRTLSNANDPTMQVRAERLARDVAQLPVAAPAAAALRAVAVSPDSASRATLLRQASQDLEAVLDATALRRGAWLATAELAARRHDNAFFESTITRRFIGQVPTVDRVAHTPVSDWDAVLSAIEHAIRDGTR